MVGPVDHPQNPGGDAVKMVKRKVLIGLAAVAGVYLLSLIYLLIVGLTLRPALGKASQAAKDITVSLQEKNLSQATESLNLAETELKVVSRRYNLVGWLKVVPGLGIYVSDGRHGLNAAMAGAAAGKNVTRLRLEEDNISIQSH